MGASQGSASGYVALRKESVDRNNKNLFLKRSKTMSLSARRAWIEIPCGAILSLWVYVALRKESVDRNVPALKLTACQSGRSPQGERG